MVYKFFDKKSCLPTRSETLAKSTSGGAVKVKLCQTKN